MTDTIYPLGFQWDGESMIPLNPRLADKYYVVGETYRMVPQEDRSQASHRAYFAAIREAWQNLPEQYADHLPTDEHLRKWALIKAGYRDERTIACASKAEAQRIAAFIKPMDDYAVVVAREAVVTVYTAKSQSMRAMGRRDFEESKHKVLDVVASLVETDVETLKENAGRAA